MDWLVQTFRDNPSIPIFLTLGLGFWIGKFKYKTFSLGTVTSVLLVGVLVGQLDIPISGPVKSLFFLLFLFAIGYSVGPQFFRALKGTGIKQVIFAVVMCVLTLAVTVGVAKIFGYNPGEAAGLFAGAQTISAVIGVGDDTIKTLGASAADKQNWMDIIPVCYAVTYIFGTIGSAYILSYIGPMMLGGIKKVRQQTIELEKTLNDSSISSDPSMMNALRPVAFRAYSVEGEFFNNASTVADVEKHISEMDRRMFVERVRSNGQIIDSPAPGQSIAKGDVIVLSGRREFIVEDESWLGPEVADAELLSFPVEKIPVMIANKAMEGKTIDELRAVPAMQGVAIVSVSRAGQTLPVLAKTKLYRGDMITVAGLKREVDAAAKEIGYADRPSNVTDMVFVGLGIFIGALIGAITIRLGGIPVSLSTSGGALIAGLVLGWLRSKHPTFGRIPDSSVWLLNNLGLNMFIAVIGITAAPTFVSGIKEVGAMLFVAGVIATTLPLIIGIWMGDKIFKFHPAINLGCVAGSRVTTASLGAIQDALGSTTPALGYTITYAVANTLLILMGVAITLICA
ncbi:MAG: aspartate-alanine antiporter [Muribaculaceae bacterium]|nr:aspartate-alanine antiporter [Muribaculaceae bacterium]